MEQNNQKHITLLVFYVIIAYQDVQTNIGLRFHVFILLF